jgi:hypothetical protein
MFSTGYRNVIFNTLLSKRYDTIRFQLPQCSAMLQMKRPVQNTNEVGHLWLRQCSDNVSEILRRMLHRKIVMLREHSLNAILFSGM